MLECPPKPGELQWNREVLFCVEMILAWPLVGLIAGCIAWNRRGAEGGRGRSWFVAWIAAGFLMSFSLITWFSIGLFILPFAAGMLIWVAHRAPHVLEALGFAAGIGATAVLIVAISV
jgi:hypothetical protein